MKTEKYSNMPSFVTGPASEYPEDCPKCNDGEIYVGEGYDIYEDKFYFYWECSDCNYSANVEADIIKYQKYLENEDKWIDLEDEYDEENDK